MDRRHIHGLTVCVWNANSIRTQADEFRVFLRDEAVDVCLVTETHLKPGVNVGAANYRCYRNDRETAGGGTAAYVKTSLRHYVVNLPKLETVEATGVAVHTSAGLVLFVAAYRPPRGILKTADFRKLLTMQGNLFIGGDFNAKHAEWHSRVTNPNGRRLLRVAQANDAVVVGPFDPTIYPRQRRADPDVLDVAIIKGACHTAAATTRCALSSDHLPVIFDIDTDGAAPLVTRRQLKDVDWDHFRDHLTEVVADVPDPGADGADAAIAALTQLTLDAVDAATPRRQQKPRDNFRQYPPEFRQALREKNRLYREWQITRLESTKAVLNRMRRELTAAGERHRNRGHAGRVATMNTTDGSAWKATAGTRCRL